MAIILKNGAIIDGTNRAEYFADVQIIGDVIAQIAQEITPEPDDIIIDCTGKKIAPGFIDVHTHDDEAIFNHQLMHPKITQGITSVIVGNCGISIVPLDYKIHDAPFNLFSGEYFKFRQLSDYRQAISEQKPLVNVGALIGHTALRFKYMRDPMQIASDAEIKNMANELENLMQQGALGLSSGVYYHPARSTTIPEIQALSAVLARHGGVYTTHIRDERDNIIDSMDEASIAAGGANHAPVPLILSHHKCAGKANHGRSNETLNHILKLNQNQPVAFDAYPYEAGSTILHEDFIVGTEKILISFCDAYPEMVGKYLDDIAKIWGISRHDACLRLKPAGAIYFQMRADDVARIIAHPLGMIGSDGLPHDKNPHPRLYGTFPRVIGKYCRDEHHLDLPLAIHKMTGLSAKNFQLTKRGQLINGNFADIVIFDYENINDCADFQNSRQLSVGIEWVIVNGEIAVRPNQQITTHGNGRYLQPNHNPQI